MTCVIGERGDSLAIAAIGAGRLLRGLHEQASIGLVEHRRLHGAPVKLDASRLIGVCHAVNLAGRGGAGFPVAQKLAGLAGGRRAVVVNATESEPASYKDRLLITAVPHLVLDGALLVADAIGAGRIHVAVHGAQIADSLERALAERGARRRFRVRIVTGGFVSGEARAVIRSLNGGPAVPPGRRTLPTEAGVGGLPTFLSNAETFAQIAVLASLGPAAYASVGTREEPGTTLLTVGGAVAHPAVFEVPIGTELDTVLTAAGARPPAGIVIGGYHGSWHTWRPNLTLSHKSLTSAGGTLGAGVILIIDGSTCGLGELARVAAWLAEQSARQCGPCTFGLPAIVSDLAALARGDVRAEYNVQRHAAVVTGRGACAHPDGASRFVASGIRALPQEMQTHRVYGSCGRPVQGQLPLKARSLR